MKAKSIIVSATAVVLFIASLTSAEILYTITDLGAGAAYDINIHGQVVGLAPGGLGGHGAYMWENNTGRFLGFPGRSTAAHAINDYGQVVGRADFPWNNTSAEHAIFWENGVSTDYGQDLCSYNGINNLGQAVGYGPGHSPAIWIDGVMTGLPAPGFGGARDISDTGVVAGYAHGGCPGWTQITACIWDGGVRTCLGRLGSYISEAYAINNAGQVVGLSHIGDSFSPWHAFIWENGVMTDLGTLGVNYKSEARGINNLGQVVGKSGKHAFLWENGVMIDLHTVCLGISDWDTTTASAINDNGVIVGYGSFKWKGHAFIMTPIPEPSTVLLIGLGGLILRKRRR